MIIDLNRFLKDERPYWNELESMLAKLEDDASHRLDLARARRLHYLYERASTDLSKIVTFASEPELRRMLESLVARAYGEIHEARSRPQRFAPVKWAFGTFPQTFHRQIWAFWFSLAVTLFGALFGGFLVTFDEDAKAIIMPFPHLQIDPSERVAMEEREKEFDERAGTKAQGTSFYFTHNTRVAIFTMCMGISWGLGSIILLFYNGVLLGAVTLDYVNAGETVFLVGWLLPHGSVEIPAILLAGQAGLVLGRALIGWGTNIGVKGRLREIMPDLVTLIIGAAILLAWAGFIEAFLSQYHEPIIPYWVKISFGTVQLTLLILYLWRAGAAKQSDASINE